MFRKITVLFLLFAFSAQVFSRATIIMDYYTNTTAYSEKCENKSRPQMHCKGKCQMMKKLREEEKKEQESPGNKAELKIEVLSSKSFFTHITINKTLTHSCYTSHYLTAIPKVSPSPVFHPPAIG